MKKGGEKNKASSKKVNLAVSVKKNSAKKKAVIHNKRALGNERTADKKNIKPKFENTNSDLPTERDDTRIISMRVEREKKFIMWSGVIFFMVLIGFFWIYNIRNMFLESKMENRLSGQDGKSWQELSREISEKLADFEEGLKSINDFSSEASPTAVADTQEQERNLFNLSKTATNSSEIGSSTAPENIKVLKEKIESLNNN